MHRETSILVGANGTGGRWHTLIQPMDNPRINDATYQNEPHHEHIHQRRPAPNTDPGVSYLNVGGIPNTFDRAWLGGYISIVNQFKQEHYTGFSAHETGAIRSVPNAAELIRHEIELLEASGTNHELWVRNPVWAEWVESTPNLNFRFGSDPQNVAPVVNDLRANIIRSRPLIAAKLCKFHKATVPHWKRKLTKQKRVANSVHVITEDCAWQRPTDAKNPLGSAREETKGCAVVVFQSPRQLTPCQSVVSRTRLVPRQREV